MKNDNEETFNLSFIFKTINKRITLVLLVLFIGLIVTGYLTIKSPILYGSNAILYVKPNSLGNSGVEYNDILSSQRLVKTYVEILKSRKMINNVIEELKLGISYEKFLNYATIEPVRDTELISISIRNESVENAQEITRTLINIFLKDVKDNMNINNIHVIDEATYEDKIVSPNIIKNLFIGIFSSALVGILVAFALEGMDSKIKTHEDIKKYLGYNTIGVIPKEKVSKAKITKEAETNLKIINEPRSILSESIRMIRTNLNFLDIKVINITSTMPGEGKSNIISNLAASFASTGKKVIIIDCDIRKPTLHEIFKFPKKDGLTDLAVKGLAPDYKNYIRTFNLNARYKMDIITAGSRVSNPSELLNSKKFKAILDEIKMDYDLVFLDTPPITAVSDSIIVSKESDGTIYVIESDKYDNKLINSALEQLKSADVSVLGTVLNKVNTRKEKALYGNKYGYYYEK